jgi:phage-related baseplate assembly protein
MATLPPELANLPAPELIEVIDYEARLGQLRAILVQLLIEAGIDYDVGDGETDTGAILQQANTYVDIGLRQRINEAIQANLLAYAYGGDLDHLAQFYDVTRLSGEADEKLRVRVVLAIRGRSTGGTEPRYRSVALDADIRVADATVYTVGKDPTVNVAIFSTDNAGVADQALIDKVNAALQNPAVRMVNDKIVVAGASRSTTPIVADVWLLPETSDAIVGQMSAALTLAWTEAIVLGRDVTRSWITSKLMLEGVQRVDVTSPAADIVVPFNQAAALGTITLNNKGRAY